jgi:uncharacterized ParB-like nuclease family protein
MLSSGFKATDYRLGEMEPFSNLNVSLLGQHFYSFSAHTVSALEEKITRSANRKFADPSLKITTIISFVNGKMNKLLCSQEDNIYI